MYKSLLEDRSANLCNKFLLSFGGIDPIEGESFGSLLPGLGDGYLAVLLVYFHIWIIS